MDIRGTPGRPQPIKRTVGFAIAGDEDGEGAGSTADGHAMAFGDGVDAQGAVGSPSPVYITPHFDGTHPSGSSLESGGDARSADGTRGVRTHPRSPNPSRHPRGVCKNPFKNQPRSQTSRLASSPRRAPSLTSPPRLPAPTSTSRSPRSCTTCAWAASRHRSPRPRPRRSSPRRRQRLRKTCLAPLEVRSARSQAVRSR